MFHSFYLFQQSDSSTRGKARLQTEDDHIIIFYNRVPKTGSTSFMGVLYALCRPNRFHALHLNVSRNSHVMSLSDQIRFARNITTWQQFMKRISWVANLRLAACNSRLTNQLFNRALRNAILTLC